MSLAVLELNDQALLIQAEEGECHAEPGFASLSLDGIETGDGARASAWRQPQHSYNQYWAHLNQSPLAAAEKHARHHADIAFAQLRHLWQQAGRPESLVLLAPGSFSDAQLSQVLGLVGALPCAPAAVIDSGLAGCLGEDGDALYVDVQLHQTVVTICRRDGAGLRVEAQETFPQFGALQVHNTVARHISNLLIDSARYDPLHASDSEQEIFDRLPGWLARLRNETELASKLMTPKGELPFILRRNPVRRLLNERLKSIRAFVSRHSDVDVLLSHPSLVLLAVAEEFEDARVAGHAEAVQRVLSDHASLLTGIDGLYRVQALDVAGGESRKRINGRIATHLLLGDRAVSLAHPVNLRVGPDGPELLAERLDAHGLTLVRREHVLELLHNETGLVARLPSQCVPGESVRLGEHELRLIEVHGG
ncbi:MAG: hypothetical protein HKN58_06640 [Xanthomonadales bacterium]|nr:hypothetical protein [Xanthomonadales bacterium]